MLIFHADLDQTLIYSYKHDIGSDKQCVELYQEREISFMRPDWIEAIRRIQKKILFVPTTTRTMEQYQRIDMGIAVPAYALVCNGGILLENGRPNHGWYRESRKLAADAREELDQAIVLLEQDRNRCMEVRLIEQLFIFTKSTQPEESMRRLKEQLDETKVDICQNGTKIYVLPKQLNKGMSVVRLKNRLHADQIFAAGDSEFDKSMLLAADTGICPAGLFEEEVKSVLQFPKEVFTTELLRTMDRL